MRVSFFFFKNLHFFYSRSLGRFHCSTSAYDHAQFNAHLTSGVVGAYNPYLQGTSLKVPGLDGGYQGGGGGPGTVGYGSPSALQQALLSPTPLEYRTTAQQQHVNPILQGLLSPRHSLTGHADPRLPQQDLVALLKRQSPRPAPSPSPSHAPTNPPQAPTAPTPQDYSEMLLLRQLAPGSESLEANAPPPTQHYHHHHHHLLQIRTECGPAPVLPHSESMEEDDDVQAFHDGLLAKAPAPGPCADGHELLAPLHGDTPPYSSPTHRHTFMRGTTAQRGGVDAETLTLHTL